MSSIQALLRCPFIKPETKKIIWRWLRPLIGVRLFELIRASSRLGYVPNLKSPKSFNEKLIRYKLYGTDEMAKVIADKYAVRDYIKSKIGAKYLNKVYFTGDPDAIPFDDLPKKFVIKTNNGNGTNCFIQDKDTVDKDKLKKKLKDALAINFGLITNELWYTEIERKIIIEEMLEDPSGLKDYKFFCSYGECELIQVDIDRFTEHRQNFYNSDWEQQDFKVKHPRGTDVKKPDTFDEMLALAKKLSASFEFLRVDLYEVNGEIRFGELTLVPDAGWGRFFPREMDYELGRLIKSNS